MTVVKQISKKMIYHIPQPTDQVTKEYLASQNLEELPLMPKRRNKTFVHPAIEKKEEQTPAQEKKHGVNRNGFLFRGYPQ